MRARFVWVNLLGVCTLAIYFRLFPNHPLVLAANRDEFLDRPTSPPGFLDASHYMYGGRDERHGGTWFGVNRNGMAAALLNRRSPSPPDPTRMSRGLLCLNALRQSSAGEARRWADDVVADQYNPFNLVVADRIQAWVATVTSAGLRFVELDRGFHLITNLDLNDPTCPRIAASYRLFARLAKGASVPNSMQFRKRLQDILAQHDTELDPRMADPGNSLCVHAGAYGTRSSSFVHLDQAGNWTYFHSDDPPCRGRLERRAAFDPVL